MTDMTIKAVRTTMLRVPWPETPWLKGHAFGEARNLLVLEVETKGGIVGMGYLFSFRPGLKTVVAALEETILPHVIGPQSIVAGCASIHLPFRWTNVCWLLVT